MNGSQRTAILKRAVKRALAAVSRAPFAYDVCKRVVDLHNGEQECDMGVNGELRFLREQLRDARVAFDVGANVGDWAEMALATRPDLCLHCFEPFPPTFDLLRTRGLRGDVHLHNVALGAQPGTAMLKVVADGRLGGVNSLVDRRVTGDGLLVTREEEVQVDTFDAVRARLGIDHVDFVKIDTEGFEFDVLRGMRDSLSSGRVRTVQFEYGGTYIAARVLLLDIWRFVEALDVRYRVLKLFPEGARVVPRYTEALENFQYANYALQREE